MPRSLILHIGTMKTGSTTTQLLLSYNRAALRERGICYPRTIGVNNHSLLAFKHASAGLPGTGDSRPWGQRSLAEAIEEACTEFHREMAELPPEVSRVIVSGEIFGNHVRDPVDVGRLRDFFAPYFDSMEILVYLRRQDCHVASNYSQTLRRGVLSRPSLVSWKDKKEGFTYHYDKLLAPWAEVFGEAAIKPRIFERDTNKSWDVVADFIAATGTGPLPPPAEGLRQNPSINAAGQRALREIGFILKGEDKGQDFARTRLWTRLSKEMTDALPGRGWQPMQAEARDFNTRFDASNERVRARWFPDRTRLFSDDYSFLPEKLPKLEADDDLRAVTAVLINTLRKALERDSKERAQARRGVAVKRALRLNKDDPVARLELARLMMERGEFDTARMHVERLLKEAPEDAAALELGREIEAQAADEGAEVDELELPRS